MNLNKFGAAMSKTYQQISGLILFAALAYAPIFMHLDALVIRQFDEARLAANAYEMHKTGDWIVTYYTGETDLWNTKPPLMIWLQVFFIKLIGYNEIAIRLPAAIAAFLTCLVILAFSWRFMKKYWLGMAAVLVLLTSQGYVRDHGIRTGDYDALLTFFTTLSCLSFFIYTELKDQGKRNIYLTIAIQSLTFAVLTKSVAGLMFTPALAIFALARKQFVPILRSKVLYLNLLAFVLIVGGYYALRESQNPGYIDKVVVNELGGRYLDVIEGHRHTFMFYIDNIRRELFHHWRWLLLFGAVVGFAMKDRLMRRLTAFLVLLSGFYILVISFSQTKTGWYDVPVYPFLAMITAVFIYWIYEVVKGHRLFHEQLRSKYIPAIIVLALIFIQPYEAIIEKVYKPKDEGVFGDFYSLSYLLRDDYRKHAQYRNYDIAYQGYPGHLLFYVRQLKAAGEEVRILNYETLQSGDQVMASQAEVIEYIEENYDAEKMGEKNNIYFYQIR